MRRSGAVITVVGGGGTTTARPRATVNKLAQQSFLLNLPRALVHLLSLRVHSAHFGEAGVKKQPVKVRSPSALRQRAHAREAITPVSTVSTACRYCSRRSSAPRILLTTQSRRKGRMSSRSSFLLSLRGVPSSLKREAKQSWT